MSKECFSCGASFNGSEKQLALHFKGQYEKHGVSRYGYKLKSNGGLFFVRAEYFNEILITQIKPNFANGSDFFHISELR